LRENHFIAVRAVSQLMLSQSREYPSR